MMLQGHHYVMMIVMMNMTLSHLGNNDLLLQDLHCIISSTGLLFHQDHLPEGAFTQQLQIVEVIHCLTEQETDKRSVTKL